MPKTMIVCGLAIAGLMLASTDTAQARPQYLKAFIEKYEGLEAEAKEVKCGICHPAKSKKVRNQYALEVGKNLQITDADKKGQTDLDIVKEALGKAESVKSHVEGKTYGALIEAGELPGDDKPAGDAE